MLHVISFFSVESHARAALLPSPYHHHRICTSSRNNQSDLLSISLSTSTCMRPNTFKLLRLEILPAPRKKLSHLCLFRDGSGRVGCRRPASTAKEGPRSQRFSDPEAVLIWTPSSIDALAFFFFIPCSFYLCGLVCISQSRPRSEVSLLNLGSSLFETSATTVGLLTGVEKRSKDRSTSPVRTCG